MKTSRSVDGLAAHGANEWEFFFLVGGESISVEEAVVVGPVAGGLFRWRLMPMMSGGGGVEDQELPWRLVTTTPSAIPSSMDWRSRVWVL